MNNESAYLNKVARLELIGLLYDEGTRPIRMELTPTSSSYWTSLAMFQRKILVAQTNHSGIDSGVIHRTSNKVQKLIDMSPTREVAVHGLDGETCTVIIPAVPPSDPPNETKSIKFLKSNLGGNQLLVIGSQSITYCLPLDTLSHSIKYWLQLRVCTVHRHEEPFLVTISSSVKSGEIHEDQHASIDIPYTMGMWEFTKAVLIELGGSELLSVKLKMTRQSPQGLSVKDIKLTPCEA